MRILPRRRVSIETRLPAAAVLEAIAPAVELVNGPALVVQLRAEVDEANVWVGWWPAMAFTRGGIRFEGSVDVRGDGAVLAGEIGYFPPGHARSTAIVLVLAALVPLLVFGALGAWRAGLLGAAWLGGGGRFALGLAFHRYAERIERVLRAATSDAHAATAPAPRD